MTFFTRPWRTRQRHPGRRHEPTRPRSRPAVELLEDRVVLSTLRVGPGNFPTLQAAVIAANPGDTIQIEPNFTPGGATVNKPLVIQGDPTNSGPNAGQMQVGPLILAASGITLQNLNLSTVTIHNGQTGEVIRNDNVVSITQTPGAAVNGNNTISGDVITGTVILGNDSLPGDPAAGGDRVLNNVFNSSASVVLTVQEDNGALIQGNIINDGAAGATGILAADDLSASVSGNVVNLRGGGSASIGIRVSNSALLSESAQVVSNRIQTNGQGTGILVMTAKGSALTASLANNDLVLNQVGVHIIGDGTSSASALGTVDLGGGSQGSLGGNDFHGYFGGGHFAIVTTNAVATSDTISALNNIFSVTPASAAVQANAGTVNTNSPLSANAAIVDRIYENFFGRSGNPTSELPVWANLITSPKSLSNVTHSLAHSFESLERIINQGYLVILGRQAEPGAFSAWVPYLQTHTAEQFFALLFSSSEFQARIPQLVGTTGNASLDYIQSLYYLLFGRTGSAGEIASWAPFLATNGRFKLALLFLTQGFEFRTAVIDQLYAGFSSQPAGRLASIVPDMFNRLALPSSLDVSAWLGTKLSLLDLYATFATAPEFAANG